MQHGNLYAPNYIILISIIGDRPRFYPLKQADLEVVDLIQEAIQFHLQYLKAEGQPVPKPASKSKFIEVALTA